MYEDQNSMTDQNEPVSVRNTAPRDFAGITELCRRIYPDTPPWNAEQLSSHLRLFPDGQFVAVHGPEERIVGMAASLIVDWDHYNMLENWEQFTADGMFTNHDPKNGQTLYGAEVIVDPTLQHHGIGDKLYRCRRGPDGVTEPVANSGRIPPSGLSHLCLPLKAGGVRHGSCRRCGIRSHA